MRFTLSKRTNEVKDVQIHEFNYGFAIRKNRLNE